MTTKEIGDLFKFGGKVQEIALDLNAKRNKINFWEIKKAQAEHYLKGHKEEEAKLRKKLSKELARIEAEDDDFDYHIEGCFICGFETNNTDLCDYCYNISEGIEC